jgi:hypothetical protein
MTDWKNIFEQFLHFTLLGMVPAYFSIEAAIVLLCVRELSGWRWLPWPIRGQWPPGDPDQYFNPLTQEFEDEWSTQMDRVEDLRVDLIFTQAGMIAGHALSRVWWVL